MQALRLARQRVSLRPARVTSINAVRSLTATAHAGTSATATSATTSASSAAVPLSNVEAQWEVLTSEEQVTVHQQLAEIQKKDWRTLSIDEKKAAYYVAFGPHGPRKPTSHPGDSIKIFFAVLAAMGVAYAVGAGVKSFAPPPPKTINKEWEEAMNQRAIEQKMDPMTGIASEGYKGPTFVQTK